MLTKQEILEGLKKFQNRVKFDEYYSLRGCYISDLEIECSEGVMYAIKSCNAFWLLEEIKKINELPQIKEIEWNTSKLWVFSKKENSGILTLEKENTRDSSEEKIVFLQSFQNISFPLDFIVFHQKTFLDGQPLCLAIEEGYKFKNEEPKDQYYERNSDEYSELAKEVRIKEYQRLCRIRDRKIIYALHERVSSFVEEIIEQCGTDDENSQYLLESFLAKAKIDWQKEKLVKSEKGYNKADN